MTTLILWEVTLKPEFRDRSDRFLLDQLPATRDFSGCQSIKAYRDQADPDHLVLVEHWDSFDHYRNYVAWRQETGVLPDFLEMCASTPVVKSYDFVG